MMHHGKWSTLLQTVTLLLVLLLISVASGQDILTCDFEPGSQCVFIQDLSDTADPPNQRISPSGTFDWELRTGNTPTSNTGPAQAENGFGRYYIYLESSDPRQLGNFARMASPHVNYIGTACLNFYYQMFGENVGELRVLLQNNDSWDSSSLIWSQTGNRGNQWLLARQTISLSSTVQRITFQGIRGSNYRGDIAIDTLVLQRGSCDGVVITPTPPPTTGGGETVNLPFSCSFEQDTICNFIQRTDDTQQFDWFKLSGSTPTTDTGPTMAQNGIYFMYVEASERNPGNMAVLDSPRLNAEGDVCVEFWYHMFGEDIGSLGVYSSSRSNTQGGWMNSETWWSTIQKPGENSNEWKRQLVDLSISRLDRVGFVGVRGEGHRGDISVDNVRIFSGKCQDVEFPPPPTQLPPGLNVLPVDTSDLPFLCTFETDLCGMFQRIDDRFDWTRLSGRTPTEGTGPDRAILGTFYIYAEASDPRKQGDTAVLETPGLTFNGQVCITFYYQMSDNSNAQTSMGELLVYQSSRGESTPLFRVTGNQGSQWLLATVSSSISSSERIVFKATRGSNIESDIAIDNIEIKTGVCGGVIVPTPSPPTPPPTPGTGGSGQILSNYNCGGEGDGSFLGNCRMRQDTVDNMEWTMQSGRTPSGLLNDRRINGQRVPVTGPDGAAVGNTYLFMETSGRGSGEVARLFLEGTDFQRGGDNCLRFRYSMNGFHIGDLRVYVIQNGQRKILWRLTGDQLNGWKSAAVEANMNGVSQIGIEGTTKGEFSGDISLDDIQMVSGRCEAIPSQYVWQCNFETSSGAATLCSMEQDTGDTLNFDWELWTKETPSPVTGPSNAFNGAFYIYIEASSPRQNLDEARIWTPPLSTSGTVCVEFYRHMYGFHTGTLSVHTRSGGFVSSPFYVLTGQQGPSGPSFDINIANNWYQSAVTIEGLRTNDQIGFRGVRGIEFSGDIALDNIRIRQGSCFNSG